VEQLNSRHDKSREIIAIDGPAGAGKSTVSKMLARRLKYLYLDTGAMYRAVALAVQRAKLDPEDEEALAQICAQIRLSFKGEGDEQKIYLDGAEVTQEIRQPEIGWLASVVSTKRPVREAMVQLQRKLGERGRIVAEGRDTGTVVFPQAEFKFFLTAQIEERARRRQEELRAKGYQVPMEEVQREINRRDAQDAGRELAPLRPAPDAHIIDSTRLSPQEVVDLMLELIKKRKEES
jgi:cytidylate kinase